MGEAEPPAPGTLQERLRDPHSRIRLGAAADALLQPEPPAMLGADLASLLVDPEEDVRKLAARALARIGPDAFPALERALGASQPPAVRAAACQAVGVHGPVAAALAAALGECLRAAEENVRFAASLALSRIGGAAVPQLVCAIDGASAAGTIVAAADAAGAIGVGAGESEDALRRVSGHRDARVRLACAEALARVSGRPATALSILVEATHAEDDAVRSEAVRRIGGLQEAGRGAEDVLLGKCADASPKVRAASALSLALVGSRSGEALEALGRLVDDHDRDVRIAAAAAVAHLREEGRPLLSRLERLRDDPDPRVSAAARAAVDRVSGQEPRRPPVRPAGAA